MRTTQNVIVIALALCLGVLSNIALAEDWSDLSAGIRPNEHIVIGGQPTAELLREAAASGVQVVVNFRPADEGDPGYDEASLAAELGVQYLQVPVAREGGLTAENLALFDAVLRQVGDQPALMHCSTGNRVGAMYALHAALYEGMDTEAAIEFGKAHGLTHFEDEVRAELEAEKAP